MPVGLEKLDPLDLLLLHSLRYCDDPGRTYLARFFEHPQMAATMNGWLGREAILEFIAEQSDEPAPSSSVLSDSLERNQQPPGLADPGDINSGGTIGGVGEGIYAQNGGLSVTPGRGGYFVNLCEVAG